MSPQRTRARRTKIVATIGPATSSARRLRQIIEAGVDVCRLNFSHGTHASHSEVLERIRAIEEELGRPVAVLQDLCGPKIRVTQLPGGSTQLVEGQQVKVVAGLKVSEADGVIGASLDNMADHATPGDRLLMDDGLIELSIVAVSREERTLECTVVFGGLLKERKGINLPDTPLDVPSLTEKDKADLAWGLANGVQYVALSFVRHEEDVKALREAAQGMTHPPRFIAKIEKPEAVRRIREIALAFDGLMVARGDLSIEIPLWRVPAVQKDIIDLATRHDRLVITATQMLDSMQSYPRPTRAEVSDVANAIYDGTDAVMLSGETASGRFPVEAVTTMRAIAEAADTDAAARGGVRRHESLVDTDTFCDAICNGAITTAEELHPCALVAFSRTGKTALYLSKYQPSQLIVGATSDRHSLRTMCLFRGVYPLLVESREHSEWIIEDVEQALVDRGLGKTGDVVIFVGGSNLGTHGNVNSLKVRKIGAPQTQRLRPVGG